MTEVKAIYAPKIRFPFFTFVTAIVRTQQNGEREKNVQSARLLRQAQVADSVVCWAQFLVDCEDVIATLLVVVLL